MLLVFSGAQSDRTKAVQKVIDAEVKKGKQLVSFSDASFQKETIISYVSGADMFGNAYVVHLSRVSERAEGLEFLINDLVTLSKSETLYVVEENEINKELEKVFADVLLDDSVNNDAQISVTTFKEAKANFFGQLNAFNLVDAYNLRDKKNSWMLFMKLIAAGISAEEIAGSMMWNFKNLALYFSVAKPNADALGMKPFVYGKVAAAAKLFSKEEIATRAFDLSSALHQSHRGEGDGATLLELFILKSL